MATLIKVNQANQKKSLLVFQGGFFAFLPTVVTAKFTMAKVFFIQKVSQNFTAVAKEFFSLDFYIYKYKKQPVLS